MLGKISAPAIIKFTKINVYRRNKGHFDLKAFGKILRQKIFWENQTTLLNQQETCN